MPQSVDEFMAALVHRHKAEVESLRAKILSADPRLGEQIKWNAPSFGIAGDDRITFRLQPGDKLDLIFHRGAKVKDNSGFSFTDDTGLLKFLAPDRAILSFTDGADIAAKAKALKALVKRWIDATT